MMKRFCFALLSALLLTIAPLSIRAQAAPAAYSRPLRISVGATGSVFQPDYAGGGVAQASPERLYGFGAYVDVRFRRWLQMEGEARWLRYNQFVNIHQDNYLIGPRVPIHDFGRFTPYGKVLVGIGKMNFEYNEASCKCTNIAYGGGVDVYINPKFTFRLIDFEYQQYPSWYQFQNAQLHPYGGSMGFSYRVF